MAAIGEQEIKKQIESGTLSSVYFFYGNDDYLKHFYSSKISKTLVSHDDCFNYQRFTENCNLQEVYDACEQYPMMSEKKYVELYNYDFEKCDEASFSRLVSLVGDIPDTTVFVIVSDSVVFDEKKSTRYKKLCSAVEAASGMIVKMDHRQPAELVRMLCAGAAKHGCILESSTAKYIIYTCSSDINILKNELLKLTAYVGEGRITTETVDLVCTRSVEASVYNISRELCAGNIGKSMKILDELIFLKVSPVVILLILSTAFIEMYIGKTGSARCMKPADIAADFGYKKREFVITRAIDASRRLSEKQLCLCLRELLSADEKLKSTAGQDRVIIEELMVKLVYIMSEGNCIDKA